MANYNILKSAIQSVIKANGNNEITGPILQTELLSMITTLGLGYQYIGIAQPSTDPGTPDARVMYIAYTPGTYTHFGGTVVTGLCVLKYSTVWTKEDIPISGGTSFSTEPDDLTLRDSVLEFANRENLMGEQMGYVILRKGGGTLQDQIQETDTIYEIRYDFDLGGSNLYVPSGCVFVFNGGSIGNGTIVFDKTLLLGNVKILQTADASGTIINDFATPQMFGAKGDNSTNDTKAFENAVAVCDNIFVPNGNYLIDAGSKSLGYGIRIMRSGVTFRMDELATLYAQNLPAQNPANQFRCVISIEGPGVVNNEVQKIKDVIISGGHIVGGRSMFTLEETGLTTETILENYCGISARYVDNLVIENIEITDNTGDAVYQGGGDNNLFRNVVSKRNRRSGLSIGFSKDTLIDGLQSESDSQYIIYPNGNYSYSTPPRAIICTEPEPRALNPYINEPIKNLTIKNCSIDLGIAMYAFLGSGVNIRIENNRFYNVRNSTRVINITGNKNDVHYRVGNCYIRNNYVEYNPDAQYSTLERFAFAFGGTEFGSIFVSDNIIRGLKILSASSFVYAEIANNFLDFVDGINVSYYNGTKGVIVKNNSGTYTRILSVIAGSISENSYLIICGNQTDGTFTRGSINAYVTKPQVESIPYIYIVDNRATLDCPFIVDLYYLQTDKIILKDNDFNMVGNELYWFDRNGNRRYVNLTMINNHIRTSRQVVQLAGNYGETSVVMKVINNVFSGAETKFTTEEADAANLIFRNNFYVG